MVVLCKLKALSLTYYSLVLLKPYTQFALQNQLQLVRHLTISSLENQQRSNFTVNYLINSCGLSPEGAVSASKWVRLRSREKPDSVLGFLRNNGLSKTQISTACRRCPKLLSYDPNKTLLPKIDYLRSIGVSSEDLTRILVYNPAILGMSLRKRIIPTFDFLRSMLSDKNVLAVFKNCSKIFVEGHSKNVVPNIGILRELGMPQSCISHFLARRTSALLLNPQKFGQVVNEVKQMGFNLQKSTCISAICTLCGNNCKSIWNRSRQVYMTRWGWSEDDILSAFRKYPECMFTSEKKVMQVMEFLVDKMGWPSRKIAEYPVVMSYSLDKRIMPRCSIVRILLLKGFIDEIENVSLATLLCPAEKRFLEKFVAIYIDQVPQLLSVYQGKVGVEDVCV